MNRVPQDSGYESQYSDNKAYYSQKLQNRQCIHLALYMILFFFFFGFFGCKIHILFVCLSLPYFIWHPGIISIGKAYDSRQLPVGVGNIEQLKSKIIAIADSYFFQFKLLCQQTQHSLNLRCLAFDHIVNDMSFNIKYMHAYFNVLYQRSQKVVETFVCFQRY